MNEIEIKSEIASNVDAVLLILNTINDNFSLIADLYAPTCGHRDPYNYFKKGACSNYAEILYDIFKEQVLGFYDNDGHIITQIGNYCYDVNRVYELEDIKNDSSYSYYPVDPIAYFYECIERYGKKDSEDIIICNKLTELGKQKLQELIDYKINQIKTR